MRLRIVLNTPHGERVIRDTVDGCWQEPSGEAALTIGEDCWAIPGLADAHAHLASAELNYQPGVLSGAIERAQSALAAGVMLILDKGWTDTVTMEVIAGLGADHRPDIEAAARILTVADGYFPGFGRVVDPTRLATAVSEEAAEGAGWVKLVGDWPRPGIGPLPNFTETELALAVEVAESHGSRVAIHTMARDVPSMAVASGVHSIEHGLFLTEDDVAALGARGGMWVPTLLRIEATLRQLGSDSSGGKLLIEGLDNVRRLLPTAVEAGVHVLAGTDLVSTPAQVSAEALKLGSYGLKSSQVVDAVSTAAFSAIGAAADYTPGTPANVVLLATNPVDDLEALAHPSHIIRRGNLL